jgi:hypothetical protein
MKTKLDKTPKANYGDNAVREYLWFGKSLGRSFSGKKEAIRNRGDSKGLESPQVRNVILISTGVL